MEHESFEQNKSPEQHVINAGDLGLNDGQFMVHRSDGSVESGWSVAPVEVTSVDELPAHVQITKRMSDGELAIKEVSTEKLLSWQPQDDIENDPKLTEADRQEVKSRMASAAIKTAGVLIDKVPTSGEEAQKMMQSEKHELNKEQIAELKSKEQQIEQELKAIEEPFDVETKRNLWRYAAGQMNAAEAQKAGDGVSSTAEQQSAGQAYRVLAAKGIIETGNQYHKLMVQLKNVRDKIHALS